MAKPHLTAQRLREVLDYNPETGAFTWRVQLKATRPAGSIAGCRYDRYIKIVIDQEKHSAHRLVWLYVHGEWPSGVIDHINGDGFDNRLCNLRDVSQSINSTFRHKQSKATSGRHGVRAQRNGLWQAYGRENGRFKHLGSFSRLEDAISAREQHERSLLTN